LAGPTLARDPHAQWIGDEALLVRREAGQAHAPSAKRKPGCARRGEKRRRMPNAPRERLGVGAARRELGAGASGLGSEQPGAVLEAFGRPHKGRRLRGVPVEA
jgi:hypothetical protein